MLPTKFRFIWPNGFRGEEYKKSANQKKESPVAAMFVTDRGRMSNLCTGPSIDASYQASDHLAQRFQRKRFFEIDLSETRIACGGCLSMDQDEISTRYRGPPIEAPYQVSFHLAKRFQRRRFFRNQPIRNTICLWRPCLLMDRDEKSNRNRGLSIDASYQVSVHLAKWFQRRRI